MSQDSTKTGFPDSQKDQKPANLDLNDVEMVFGTPNSPKLDVKPAVHTITNETRKGKNDPTNNKNKDAELLEPDRGKPKPPLAGPEIDDLDDEKPADLPPYPGIDDGLLENGDKKPHHDDEDLDHTEGKDSHSNDHHDDHPGPDDGKWLLRNGGDDETDFAYDGMNGFGPRFGIDDRPGSPMVPGSIPDVNTYQQKKNLAQGMMDLALLSANANQLRYVVESASTHPYYYPSLVFIALSILLQIAVGVGLIMNSRYNVKDEKDICKADKINNMTVLGIFLITIVNVFITSFSVATPTTVIQQAG